MLAMSTSKEVEQAPKPRTIADEIEEFKNTPPETKKLIHKLVKAIIDSGAEVTIQC